MTLGARVVVVGGGVVGVASALLLEQAGARVTLVEPRPPAISDPATRLASDLRTLALAPGTLALLQQLDAWSDDCQQASCSYDRMHVWDAEGTGAVDFRAAELGLPELGRIVPNRTLVAALWRRLRASDVALCSDAAVIGLERGAGEFLLVLEDGRRLATDLVVAADGARSPMRQLAGIGCAVADTGQEALATVAMLAGSHQNTAWQRFLPTGPLAYLPLPPGRDPDGVLRDRVSVVWSLDATAAASMAELDDAAFAEALAAALEFRCGTVVDVDRRVRFPLRQQHARHYAAPGIVLVGDAAHVLHPLAGQGVNLGLRDVQLLGAEVRRHLRGRVPLGRPDLWASYERARRGENATMLAAMQGLQRLFGSDRVELRMLRNQGLRWVNDLQAIKRELMWPALGLEQADER